MIFDPSKLRKFEVTLNVNTKSANTFRYFLVMGAAGKRCIASFFISKY